MSVPKQPIDLLVASATIRKICDMTKREIFEIADLVAMTGKPVGYLTITELVNIIREHEQCLRNRFEEPEKN